MIKSKKELKKYYSSYGGILIQDTAEFDDSDFAFKLQQGDDKIFLDLKRLKWLFRTLAKILKAEVNIKVWCERCSATGKDASNITDYLKAINPNIIPEKLCEVCKGKGYTEKTFAELK